jgi:hypothetical protein
MFTHTDFIIWFIKHILIRLPDFMGKPNCVRILYNISLLIETYALLKSMNTLPFSLQYQTNAQHLIGN